MNYSQSEESGLKLLKDTDLVVFSVGVSTGGIAEVRMAESNPERYIIATTIDEQGVADAKKFIEEKNLSKQIDIKLEDVSQPLPYDDNYFDYIYARLVLHYLPKDKLDKTLLELKRVLKPKGKIFVVVRSTECPDAKSSGAMYDQETGLTRYHNPLKNNTKKFVSRYFHTEESIESHMTKAGFTVLGMKAHEEQLFADFMRETLAPHKDHVIEVVGESYK